jgi:hypothetical protein
MFYDMFLPLTRFHLTAPHILRKVIMENYWRSRKGEICSDSYSPFLIPNRSGQGLLNNHGNISKCRTLS